MLPFLCSRFLAANHPPQSRASADISLGDVRFFPLSLWLVFLICVTFYGGIFPFMSISKLCSVARRLLPICLLTDLICSARQ